MPSPGYGCPPMNGVFSAGDASQCVYGRALKFVPSYTESVISQVVLQKTHFKGL